MLQVDQAALTGDRELQVERAQSEGRAEHVEHEGGAVIARVDFAIHVRGVADQADGARIPFGIQRAEDGLVLATRRNPLAVGELGERLP